MWMIVIGLLIGFLSSISGLGGGFLVVPLLVYLGNKVHLAVGTSFVVVFLVASSSLISHARLGNVDFQTGLLLALGGVVGAQLGPLVLQNVPGLIFKRGFALMLMGLGAWMLYTTRQQT
ncbi:MAG: sulfite exporter TauE/SafE family protein [Nitrospinaceae bacterium]